LSTAILVGLHVGGDWKIVPSSRKQLAEPQFWLTTDVVENPGYFPWITVLRIAESWLSAQAGPRLEDDNELSPHPPEKVSQEESEAQAEFLNAEPKVVQVVDVEEFYTDTHMHVSDLQVGDSLVCYNREDAVVNNGISVEEFTPPDWLKYLDTYNRFEGTPSHLGGWAFGPPINSIHDYGGRTLEMVKGVFNTRSIRVSKELRTLRQFYGCPAIEGKGFFLLVGRARVKLSWFSVGSTLLPHIDYVDSPHDPGPLALPGEPFHDSL